MDKSRLICSLPTLIFFSFFLLCKSQVAICKLPEHIEAYICMQKYGYTMKFKKNKCIVSIARRRDLIGPLTDVLPSSKKIMAGRSILTRHQKMDVFPFEIQNLIILES